MGFNFEATLTSSVITKEMFEHLKDKLFEGKTIKDAGCGPVYPWEMAMKAPRAWISAEQLQRYSIWHTRQELEKLTIFGMKLELVPPIRKVIFNEPATIVLWEDDTKTIVKCQEGDEYSKETGLAMCIAKKALGNKGNFNDVFKKWILGYGDKD